MTTTIKTNKNKIDTIQANGFLPFASKEMKLEKKYISKYNLFPLVRIVNGNKSTVELFEGNRVKISDEGRGCPFHKRDDGIDALEAIYTMPHSGAKFNDKVFQNVAGMNG